MSILTITLPVYNAMPYLPEAIESVLGQSYSDFRFIIVDDGSTDGSAAYLDSVTDDRVTFLRQRNAGLGTTLNRLISLCETKYFARMDADDVCYPDRLDKQIAFLEKHSDVVLVGAQIRLLFDEGTLPSWRVPQDHETTHAMLRRGRFSICHPTIMLRTEVARRVGGYRLGGAGEDLDFLLRMCEAGRVANLPDVAYQYRMRIGSIRTSRSSDVHLGYAYAQDSANRRGSGRPELTLNDFESKWNQRNAIHRIAEKLDDRAEIFYRLGLEELAAGRKVRAYSQLGAAAVLRPKRALDRIIFRRTL